MKMLNKLIGKTKKKIIQIEPHLESVSIVVTNMCNFKCKICNFWKNTNKEEISITDLKKILDSVEKLNNDKLVVQFHGGETLLYKDLIKAVQYATSKGIKTSIVTNGYFLNEEKINQLSNAGLHDLNISLDSINKNHHTFLRGIPNSHDKIMDCINYMNNHPEKLNANINTVITSVNIKSIIATSRFVNHQKGLKNIYFIALEKPYLTNYDKNWRKTKQVGYLWPKDKKLIKNVFKNLITEKKQNNKISNSITQLKKYCSYYLNPSKNLATHDCIFGYLHLHINSLGQFRLCANRHDLDPIGFLPESNIYDAWKSGKAQWIRKRMQECKQNCVLNLSCVYKDE